MYGLIIAVLSLIQKLSEEYEAETKMQIRPDNSILHIELQDYKLLVSIEASDGICKLQDTIYV